MRFLIFYRCCKNAKISYVLKFFCMIFRYNFFFSPVAGASRYFGESGKIGQEGQLLLDEAAQGLELKAMGLGSSPARQRPPEFFGETGKKFKTSQRRFLALER